MRRPHGSESMLQFTDETRTGTGKNTGKNTGKIDSCCAGSSVPISKGIKTLRQIRNVEVLHLRTSLIETFRPCFYVLSAVALKAVYPHL